MTWMTYDVAEWLIVINFTDFCKTFLFLRNTVQNVYMALACIVSHIARYWLKIAKFIYPTCIQRPVWGDPVGISQMFSSEKTTGCFRKKQPPKTFWNIFTLVKSFCVKFCRFVGNSYPHVCANFCRFILIFHQMALIFPRVPIVFTFSSFEQAY